jgi:NAD(P)-dependent dehydrogenase (short-subunit alcohol dehydrogenase family)
VNRGRRNLAGSVCVVTGAASGIGLALATRLAKAGAKVAMLDLDDEALRLAVEGLDGEPAQAMALHCDVTSETEVIDAITAVEQAWHGIDVLINNAGITHIGDVGKTDAATYRKVMDVNFFGPLHCTQAALESLRTRDGAIVTISSVAGFAPLLGRSGYSASKHALHGLFDTLRCELAGEKVDVMLVCPGFTDTAIEAHALAGLERRRRLVVLSPVGKLSWLITRLAPRLYERMMVRRLR